MSSQWLAWQPFSPKYPPHERSEKGAYQLRWARNGVETPICRLGGTDTEGILYVGHTDSEGGLQRRLRTHNRAMFRPNPQRRSRIPGIRRYYEFEYSAVVKKDEIEYHVMYTQEGEKVERCLLIRYLRKFKDMPPLNASVPRNTGDC